ncbi:hypothetical protein G6F35_017721 [Rhizopus arrhizus]|nr:hypothetical protein G6F35_017721 [Rhizopus arrhizus]
MLTLKARTAQGLCSTRRSARGNHQVGEETVLRRVGRHHAYGHHPGLGVDPLERCGLQEREGLAARVAVFHAARIGDLPGQVKQVRGAGVLQHRVQLGHLLEHRTQPDAHQEDHQREAQVHAQQMRHAAAEAEGDRKSGG